MSLPTTITHLCPTGSIILWGGGDLPTGWLLCNGASLSKTDYPELAKALGASGSTFSLPDFRDRVAQGAGNTAVGTAISAGVPNVIGDSFWYGIGSANRIWRSVSGAFGSVATTTSDNSADWGVGANQGEFTFNASSSNAIYGSSSTVQPPALTAYYIIKT